MPAYLIVNVEIRDPRLYAAYVEAVPETLARHGGTYLARGGRAERLEGTWEPRRVVLLSFPTFEAARTWWASGDYAGPKALRQAAAITEMILVEGL
jgi:uncharacterized protein (DUF1330 family)